MYHVDFLYKIIVWLAGTIHGEAGSIRYAAEILAEICEFHDCYKHLYVMLMIFMYARMI